MRRLASQVTLIVILAGFLISGIGQTVLQGTPAAAQATDGPSPEQQENAGIIEIVPVTGLIDPVLAEFILDTIEAAQSSGSRGVVLQLNSDGSVLGQDEFVDLARQMRDAEVPVSVWVGPSGGATGAAAELVAIASESGMAKGTQLGKIGEQRLPSDEFGVLFGSAADRMADEAIDDLAALELGVITVFPVPEGDDREFVQTAILGDFLVNLEEVDTWVDTSGDQPRRQPLTVGRFANMGLLDELLHTVASPEVAYLLLVIGMALLLFELYTAGVGIAGGVGAVCFLLGCYGIGVLPANGWAVGLLALAMFAFAVDVQTGVPYAWTWMGMALFAVGTVFLFDGVEMSWVTPIVALVGIALTFFFGMPSMVRTRFSAPGIGREWMLGERGLALTEVGESGTVSIRDTPWPALCTGPAAIPVGEQVLVVGLDGFRAQVTSVQPNDRSN